MRNEKSYRNALVNLYECLSLSKKIKDIHSILKFYFLLGNLELENSNHKKSEELYEKGLLFAQKNNLETEIGLFYTKLNNLKFQKDNALVNSILKETLNIFKNIPVTVNSDYRLHILFHLLRFSSVSADKVLFKYLSLKLVNELFIYSRFADAFFRFYTLKTDEYIDKLHIWRIEDDELFLTVDKDILNTFTRFNLNSIFSLTKLYSNDQLFFVYITQVELEFWKWENADIENANYFISKIERIVKKNHTFSNVEYFNTLKLCFKILEFSKLISAEKLRKVFIPDLIKVINNIKSKNRNFNIIYDFTLLIYLSNKLNNSEFTNQINKLYNWIKNKKPELIKKLLIPVEINAA